MAGFAIHSKADEAIPQNEIYENLRKALGCSVLNDELRGNYKEARTIAENLYEDKKKEGSAVLSNRDGSRVGSADAALALGIVMTLQGYPGSDISILEEAIKESGTDERREARVKLWRELAILDCSCTYLGAVSTPPGKEHIDMVIKWGETWNKTYQEHISSCNKMFRDYLDGEEDALRTEVSLFLQFHLIARTSRSIARKGFLWPETGREHALTLVLSRTMKNPCDIPRYKGIRDLTIADVCSRCGRDNDFANVLSTITQNPQDFFLESRAIA